MAGLAKNQPSLHALPKPALDMELLEFRIDRQARNLTPKTLAWYDQNLALFADFLKASKVTTLWDLEPAHLRRFLLHLRDGGHNPGGVKNIYGAVKALCNWHAAEYPDWVNPLAKVANPKSPQILQEPLRLDVLKAMLATRPRRSLTGDRDRALLLFLLDSGVRHAELCGLNVGDVDLRSGSVLVRRGKGRKARTTVIGAKTRKALVSYLKHREACGDVAPLWVTRDGETRLSYDGTRQVVRRCAKAAGVKEPSLHSFRRLFALTCLRNGVDVYSLQRLMGHSELSVLQRYLAQTEEDLRRAHEKGSPVDNLL